MAGRPPKISQDDIEHVLLESGDPVLSSGEVAAELEDVAQKTIENRLRELHESGAICGKKIGHSWAWWHPNKLTVHNISETSSGDPV